MGVLKIRKLRSSHGSSNPAKTASNVAAIMFANNRTERLTTRITYEINSIVINNGHNANGTPDGKKKQKSVVHGFETHK